MIMEENILKNLILYIKDSANQDNCYSLLINKDIWNNELFVLYSKHKEGLANYYPDKNEEVLLDNKSMKDIIDHLLKMNLTYNDVLFIDSIKLEDYILLNLYIRLFTTLRSIVKNSKDESSMSKQLKTAATKVLESIENSEENTRLTIDKFSRMLILANSMKSEDEIKAKAKEKNIELIYE